MNPSLLICDDKMKNNPEYEFVFWIMLWAKMDSNHRRRKPADLQSAPFGHSGICPPFMMQNYNLFL